MGPVSPASAATLNTAITVLYDGTAPFEDWAPTDTISSGPTNNGVHEAGDDLGPNNGIVRTLDTVMLQAQYSINPPLPSATMILELTVTNGGIAEGFSLPTSACPSGQTRFPRSADMDLPVGLAFIILGHRIAFHTAFRARQRCQRLGTRRIAATERKWKSRRDLNCKHSRNCRVGRSKARSLQS